MHVFEIFALVSYLKHAHWPVIFNWWYGIMSLTWFIILRRTLVLTNQTEEIGERYSNTGRF